MMTQGQMEAAVCEGICRFEHYHMGRGPKDIHACLIGNLLVVRLMGVLTVPEDPIAQLKSACGMIPIMWTYVREIRWRTGSLPPGIERY